MIDLISRFQDLPLPDGLQSTRFFAIPIQGYEQHRLGKDGKGSPSLLLSVKGRAGKQWSSPTVLEHLRIQYDVDCRISRPNGLVEEGRFTLISCTNADTTLQAYFLRVLAPVIVLLDQNPTYATVAASIDKLVELFRAMNSAPRKSVQGLWAELFLMARLRNPAVVLAAWHTQPGDHYDFSSGEQRIEVKSASDRVREHYFTLDQLLPIPGTQVLVASIFVERAGAGVSVAELIDKIRSRVSGSAELLLHVDLVVSLTLGNGWRSALQDRFDFQLAESSLSFFESRSVPMVNPNLPLGVSDVRFRADLTGVPAVDLRNCRSLGGLFRAALHR